MNYKVTIDGKTYDLPPRTLDVDEQIEAIGALDEEYREKRLTRREVVEKMHAFVEAMAPGAMPAVDELDTNELAAACTDIISAYTIPARKARTAAQMEELRDVLNRPEVKKMLAALQAMPKKK